METAKLWSFVISIGLMVAFPCSCAFGKDVLRIDSETLKSWLNDPQVIIVDVRQTGDWQGSDKKIKGALRQDPNEVKTWAASLPKDKKIVLYCA